MSTVTITTSSGHALTFALKNRESAAPIATLIVTQRIGVAELTGADVEAILAVLLRIREKQRDVETAIADPSRSCAVKQNDDPVADESNTPAPPRTRTTGKRK